MAISLTAEAIILAINSAIKLGDALQRAYANSIKAKTILLPLPTISVRPNAARAHRFFQEEGKEFPDRIERIRQLFDEFEIRGLVGIDQDDYVEYYLHLENQLVKARREDLVDDTSINLDNVMALLRVRQWESGKMPGQSPIKLVAGTLVEIGIDYFNQVPGALNPNSSLGMAMKHFLSAIDDIPIAEIENIKALSEMVIPRLFIAAAESLQALSQDISGDEKIQAFIAATSRGIAEEVIERSRHAADDEAVKWGQLVLRSMVKHAGHYVFNAPADILHTNQGVSKLIQATGKVLLETILTDPQGMDMKGAFNIDTLDQVMRSAFGVIAEHPQMIDGRDGFREVVVGISSALAESGVKSRPDLLPELVRLVLEHTAGNFHLIVRGAPGEPGKQLLVIAVRQFLMTLSKSGPGGHWRLSLAKGQLIAIIENILEEVVSNPSWILEEVAGNTLLEATLQATFTALAGLPKDQRLNQEVLQMIIRTNLRTVVSNQAVLERVHWASDEEEVVILQKSLDLLFQFVFTSKKVAPAERIQLFTELLRYISRMILAKHPNKKGLLLIQLILLEDPDVDFSRGFGPELTDQLFASLLKVLDYRPDLLTSDLALQRIIEGVAGALKQSGYRRKGLLPELIRLVLQCTADNLQLILKTNQGEPTYLLVEALRQLLAALTTDVVDGQWKPELSGTEVLGIAENIFGEFLLHPEWVAPGEAGDSLFGEVTRACMQGLRALPARERLSPAALTGMLRLALRTAAGSPKLLKKIHWGTDAEEAAVLEHVLQLTAAFVFERSTTTGGQKLALFTDLLHYLLEMVMGRYPDKKGLLLLDLIFFEDPEVDYSHGLQRELYDQLIQAGIKVLDYRPDLLTANEAFQHIIEGVMGALKESGYQRPGLLPELLRLMLACTAENIQLIVRADDGSTRYLLVVALRPLLQQLSIRPDTDEKWRPHLNVPQLLAIVEEVLDHLVTHPHLLTEKMRDESIFAEAIKALFAALAELPKNQRLQPDSLTWLLRVSLEAAARSKQLLGAIQWGPDEEEVIILEKALELVFAYVFPAQGPSREEALEGLLEYTLEFVLRHHQDKKALLLLYLILFELPELGPLPRPGDHAVEELVEAALQLLAAQPELISKDAVWQKIIQDTAKALLDSQLDMPQLLPELLRLTMHYSALNIDLLSGVEPESRQYVLTVAMEQCLLAIAQKPKRGKWKPRLSQQQILEIVELCLDTMIRNPLWVKDKLLQLVLESVFEALQNVPEERKIPYASLRLLIENVLKAVSFRKNLVLEVVSRQGRRQLIGLTYALEGLFVTLYSEDGTKEAASWTLTQTTVLDAILDSFLQGLVEGPITKEAIDEALEPVREAMEDLAENAAFSLDELLAELEQ